MTETPRVLIAYHHSDCTIRIDQLLPTGFNVVALIHEAGAIVQAALNLRPDVILVDVSLPLYDRFKTIKTIRRLLPDTAIVFHTLCTQALFARYVPAIGAAFVTDVSGSECIAAGLEIGLRRGRKGAMLPHCCTAVSVEDLEQASSRNLTAREGEVLSLLAGGYRMKEIAYRLGISYRTVTFHKYHLRRKLGANSDAALVGVALRENIVDAADDKATAP